MTWLLIILFMSGCATQHGLNTQAIERVCTDKRCYLRADLDTVNKRCSIGSKTWDDGSPYDPAIAGKIRACTVLDRTKEGGRYQIWIAKGAEEALAHEEAHIEIYEADNYVYIPEHHKKVHGFGLGRGKTLK